MDYVNIKVIDSDAGTVVYDKLISFEQAQQIKKEFPPGAALDPDSTRRLQEIWYLPNHVISLMYHKFARIAVSQVREIHTPRPEGSIL